MALDEWLDQQRSAIEERQGRIDAIGAEIDGLAWGLYRPAGTDAGSREAP